MEDTTKEIQKELIDAIESNSLTLPTLPEVAMRVREIAEDPDGYLDQMVTVIGLDPALSIRMIRIANSPMLRTQRHIDDLKTALSRLGMEYTSNLAIGLAMEQMYQSTTEIIDKRMRAVWRQSIEVAGLSFILCKHRTNLNPAKASLAGLVHKLGHLPILKFAEENSPALLNAITLDKALDELHPIVGEKILKTWGFPEDIVDIPTGHMNFQRFSTSPDYVDIVTVANLQSYIGSENSLAKIDYSQVFAFARLGIDTDFGEEENLDEEMQSAMSLLKA